jgi:hypothetical protein
VRAVSLSLGVWRVWAPRTLCGDSQRRACRCVTMNSVHSVGHGGTRDGRARCARGHPGRRLARVPFSKRWRRTWPAKADGLLFTNEHGRPIRRTFGSVWRAAVATAGAPHGTGFHDLGHFYASLLIRHGGERQGRAGEARPRERRGDVGHVLAFMAGQRRPHPRGGRRRSSCGTLRGLRRWCDDETAGQRPVADELACKPDSVRPAKPDRRPSIWDRRHRRPRAAYPGARAGRPRTLPV